MTLNLRRAHCANLRSANRRSAIDNKPAIIAIAADGISRAEGVGERDITIRPQQVSRVPSQTRRLMLPPPWKYPERNLMLRAPGFEFGFGCPVNIDLPLHHCQRHKIIRAIDSYPGQAVAATDRARPSRA